MVSSDICQQLLHGLLGLLVWTFMFLFQIKTLLAFHVATSLGQNMPNTKNLICILIHLQSLYVEMYRIKVSLVLKNIIMIGNL